MKPIYILLLLLCAGCGTILRPVIKNDNVRVYPATYFDARIIGYAVVGKDALGLDDGVAWALWEIGGGLLDLPVSLVTDTVCLPYDLWTWKEVEK